MPETKTYSGSRLFTGESWLTDHALVVEGGFISEIIPTSSLPSSQPVEQFDNCILAPAFIDLQIYGAGGRLFAAYPQVESLEMLAAFCRQAGTGWCLPTVATNETETVLRCIDAVKSYWEQGAAGIIGLHLEGPWISAEKRGAHLPSLIHRPTLTEVKEIIKRGKDVIRIITLAPEECEKEVIELLLANNIIISAGHSNATYLQARTGFDDGITLVTHLFNAMSPLHHRNPGLVGAAMIDDKAMASIIPDGHHVDYSVIQIAQRIMKERLFVITDAVTPTAIGPYLHEEAGDKFESGGILSGSSLTMVKALQNLVRYAGIETGEALRMCSLYPARALRMSHETGRIAPGYKTPIVVLNQELELVQII